MVTTSVLLGLFAIAAPERVVTHPAGVVLRPRVEVWTSRGDAVVQRGERVRVYLRADRDAYVTVFRVDTDGRVRVLFPRDPWDDTFLRRDREYEVEGLHGRQAFLVDDYPGVGYVFAVAAVDPFDYAAVVTGDHWDYRVIADGRVRGDPYVALTDLAERIVPVGYEDWDYDLVPYYVERHYDYPRFACYDCHSYASWTYWNPYAYTCSQFRIVIYDDPWYYPYRYYGGTRVVWVRPYRPQPRYVFKEWGGVNRERDRFITRERERRPDDRERIVRRTRTEVDRIPAPRTRDRDRPGREQPDRPNRPDDRRNDRPDDRPNRPDRPDRPERPDRPDRPDRRDRPDRPDRPSAKPDRPGRTERPARPETSRRIERAQVVERFPTSRADAPRGGAERDRSARPSPRARSAEPQSGGARAAPSRTDRTGSTPRASRAGGTLRRDGPAPPAARASPRGGKSSRPSARSGTGQRAKPQAPASRSQRRKSE